jgi:hypothetical protein
MRDGILIQQRACPRCAIRRTARLAYTRATSFCFNCRLQWVTTEPSAADCADPSPAVEAIAPGERKRFEMYRAAVRAGFYSDWDPEDSATLSPSSNSTEEVEDQRRVA